MASLIDILRCPPLINRKKIINTLSLLWKGHARDLPIYSFLVDKLLKGHDASKKLFEGNAQSLDETEQNLDGGVSLPPLKVRNVRLGKTAFEAQRQLSEMTFFS
jgi:hypothetical protein